MISGAAGGLGRAFALRLFEEGADMIALDLCAAVDSAQYGMSTSADLEQPAADLRALGPTDSHRSRRCSGLYGSQRGNPAGSG